MSGIANAERTRDGNLEVSLDGGISPLRLPRYQRAPVSVHLEGEAQTSDGSPLPRVNWIRLELAWGGTLDTRGLSVCPQGRLLSATTRQAIAHCGAAAVGQGRLFAMVFVPGLPPFHVHSRLTAFNGRTRRGRRAILVHAYSRDPPVAFVIPFSIHRKGDRTVLIATIRRAAGPWPHVADFRILVGRDFGYRGRRHSYLSASCPAPSGFTAGFSVARATYTFQEGRQLTTESVRSCRARRQRP